MKFCFTLGLINYEDYVKKDIDKLTDRELAERALSELSNVNKSLVQIDKHLYWIMPILALIAVVLISAYPPLWLR